MSASTTRPQSPRYRGRHRPGHHQHPLHGVRPRGPAAHGSAHQEHAQYFPQPGWVEHDATEIWRGTQAVIEQGLARAGIAARELLAVGIANQRETTVLWDRRTGEPLHRALVWQDTRVNDRVRQLRGTVRRGRRARPHRVAAGQLFQCAETAVAARYRAGGTGQRRGRAPLLRHDRILARPGISPAAARAGMHVTDVTNASRTQLMNLATLDWDDELLRFFRIPRSGAAAHRRLQRRARRSDRGCTARRADRGTRRRPAGRADGPGLLPRGPGQEHLRHRLLHADEHRRAARGLTSMAC